MEKYHRMVQDVIDQINRVILGKEEEIREIMAAFLGDGHILLEDIPGVGKTTLAMAFSKAIQLDYRRVQFTPDVLPADLTGFSIYRREKESFVYQQGSLFCNLLLADELNRTSPKTQSALLEAMEEKKVTVEGVTRELPVPFMVIATQNPLGSAGTQTLPEAQIDRFMVNLSIGYPDYESELAMAMGISDQNKLDTIVPTMDKGTLQNIQREICQIHIHEKVYSYIVELVRKTRENLYVEQGGSPRATIALVRMARADAWLNNRNYVIPNDVMEQFPYIISHRLKLNSSAAANHITKEMVVGQILSSVKKPSIG